MRREEARQEAVGERGVHCGETAIHTDEINAGVQNEKRRGRKARTECYL